MAMSNRVLMYVAAAIHGERPPAAVEAVRLIKEWAATSHQLLPWYEEAYPEAEVFVQAKHDRAIAQHIRAHDLLMIERADLLIAEITGASGGVGAELERVVAYNEVGHWQKPVLGLYVRELGAMGALQLGIQGPLVVMQEYAEPSDALAAAKLFVQSCESFWRKAPLQPTVKEWGNRLVKPEEFELLVRVLRARAVN